MAYVRTAQKSPRGKSPGVYRRISRRQYQRQIWNKFIVQAGLAAPAAVQEPGYLAKLVLERAYWPSSRRRKLPDVRWQLQRRFIPYGVTPPPAAVQEPGYLAAVANLRQQLARERVAVDVTLLQRRFIPVGVTPPIVVGEPGFLSEIAKQRKQLGIERTSFDVRWQLQRRFIPVGVSVTGSDIGWLVSYMIHRAYGHNLRR